MNVTLQPLNCHAIKMINGNMYFVKEINFFQVTSSVMVMPIHQMEERNIWKHIFIDGRLIFLQTNCLIAFSFQACMIQKNYLIANHIMTKDANQAT